jgi:uncharacterized surface protein with fasciclin (FAS1) repeats
MKGMLNVRWLMLPLLLAVAACDDDDDVNEPASQENIVQVAQRVNRENGEFSTLLAAVTRAGLASALTAQGPQTVFAPTDAAFAAAGLNANNVSTVPVEDLRDILLYHVTSGRYLAADVTGRSSLQMANGDPASIRVQSGTAYIDDAAIVQADVVATNGVIHVINRVMTP